MSERDFSGALDARRAHQADIVERIVQDRIRTSHTLRCLLQGCHYRTADGQVCQFCGAERRDPVTLGRSLIHP